MGINVTEGLSRSDAFLKRAFDMLISLIGLVIVSWVILLAYFLATIDTGQSGLFKQTRIGRYGRPFNILKIRTMYEIDGLDSTVTMAGDRRISRLGKWLRKLKVDELPQLINVFFGQMSFVGPRPDVPGFADQLKGEDLIILSIRPGITGPATLKYRDEELLLSNVTNPENYNENVIYPDKIKINREYIRNYCFRKDLKYIWLTLTGGTI